MTTPTHHVYLPAELDEADAGAGADVSTTDSCVCVSFHVRSGHLPSTLRADLVDAVFALPEFEEQLVVRAAIPMGDSQLLEAFRARCSSMTSHAAGATCLIDARIEHCDQCDTEAHGATDVDSDSRTA
jgi:hypothetical protein